MFISVGTNAFSDTHHTYQIRLLKINIQSFTLIQRKTKGIQQRPVMNITYNSTMNMIVNTDKIHAKLNTKVFII